MKSEIYRIQEGSAPTDVVGKGAKGLLIVLDHSDKQQNMSTLEGLVKALNYTIDEDVTIVSSTDFPISINQLFNNHPYTEVILIGVTPEQVGFHLKANPYYFYKMEKFSLLLAHSLNEMNADKDKKMKFWKCLQGYFLS